MIGLECIVGHEMALELDISQLIRHWQNSLSSWQKRVLIGEFGCQGGHEEKDSRHY
jgi:hypothetical protein